MCGRSLTFRAHEILFGASPRLSGAFHVCKLRQRGPAPNQIMFASRKVTDLPHIGRRSRKAIYANSNLQTAYLARANRRDSSAGLGFERSSLCLASRG